MPLTKLQFQPGIRREGTRYSNEGGWYDCDKVRFRSGYVEKIGGWAKATTSAFLGTARKLHNFVTLTSQNYLFIGTEQKAYLELGSFNTDITPIRRTVTLGTDPITTGSAGSGIITINDPGHGAQFGDYVTFSGATDVDGILASQINREYTVTSVINENAYTITTVGSASVGGVSGGGSAVQAQYQIIVGGGR